MSDEEDTWHFHYEGEMRALIARHGQPVDVLAPIDGGFRVRFPDGQELDVREEEVQ